MKLSDLLAELRNNILHDRSAQTGGSTSDYLWDDTSLIRYINEAQRRFARRALVLRDASTLELTQLTLVDGQDMYTLHPSVLSVLSARISTRQVDLVRLGHDALGSYQPPNVQCWTADHFSSVPPGAPLAYTTDEEVVEDDDGTRATPVLRIFPVPDATAAGTLIKLRVVRLPLDDLTINNQSAVPEIPEDHHLNMLDWAAYLALRIVDVDAGDPARAQQFAQSFEVHVQTARNEVMRKLFAPKSWGFGKYGWNWGH